MAVFGIQLAMSVIMASIISKFGGKFSLARYLLCNTGLRRYLHPSDDELKELAGISKGKGKSHDKDMKNPNTFHVPKNIDLKLDTVSIEAPEVIHLRFYAEYQWAVDYSLYVTILYICTEIYYAVMKPTNEMNLSIFWIILATGLCVSIMCSITAIYFKGDEVMGERSLCLVMGLVYLLIAMIILILDEKTLEVGVDPAYESFHKSASEFLQSQGLPSTGPASKLFIKFCLAVSCAFTGALFTFPGIRMSKMFHDSRKHAAEQPILQVFISLSYVLPLIICALWIKPIGRDLLTTSIGDFKEPIMSDATFDSVRLYLILLMVILRIVLMPSLLQTFLNVAQDKLDEQKKEAGRILNTDLQKRVAGIFYYLCIVALQYVTPCLICLHCCFLYKTLGAGSWTGSYEDDLFGSYSSSGSQTKTSSSSEDHKQAAEQIKLALASLKNVFNATVLRGLFCFATWWSSFLLFSSSAVGSLYLSFSSSD